jgi:hypothetical protein
VGLMNTSVCTCAFCRVVGSLERTDVAMAEAHRSWREILWPTQKSDCLPGETSQPLLERRSENG